MPDACNIHLQSTLLGLIWVRNEVNALFHIGSTFWLRLEPILFVFAPLLGPAVSGLINLLGSKTSTTCYTRLEIFYTAHLKVQFSFPTAAKQLRKNLQLVLGFTPSTSWLHGVCFMTMQRLITKHSILVANFKILRSDKQIKNKSLEGKQKHIKLNDCERFIAGLQDGVSLSKFVSHFILWFIPSSRKTS